MVEPKCMGSSLGLFVLEMPIRHPREDTKSVVMYKNLEIHFFQLSSFCS